MAMILFLIGYRGAGKTTVAQRLAFELGWDWIDADDEVELRAGRSIAAIFEREGEAAFRALESEVMQSLATRDRTVIALGGGAVLDPKNRAALNRAAADRDGRVVWLRGSAEQLWNRIQADVSTGSRRPNLTKAGGISEITAMLERRAPFYSECAHHVVDTDHKTPGQVADEILALLDGLPR
jgi:shikimate kinase